MLADDVVSTSRGLSRDVAVAMSNTVLDGVERRGCCKARMAICFMATCSASNTIPTVLYTLR